MARTPDKFTILDSGERQEFPTGCHRDTRGGKGRHDLLPVFVLERDACHYEKGGTKYEDRNWEKGMPFSRCLDSALRHINQYLQGDRTEDHLAAARFNIACVMHYEEMIQRDLLPAELCDLPSYAPLLPSQVSAELAPPLGVVCTAGRVGEPSPDKETPNKPPTCLCCHKRPVVMGWDVCSECI